jgi:LPS sulfotransferase NodH
VSLVRNTTNSVELGAIVRPARTYLICATQRSGSTLLCELLKETGVAGRPEEYFEALAETGLPAHPGDYLEDIPPTGAGIRDDVSPPPAPEHSSLQGLADYHAHIERTFRLGTGENGVFGAKLMWRHLPELHQLAGQLPEYAGLDVHTLLERLFGDPRYVWVTRRDKVRQAVSLWRALQTRTWRLQHPREQQADELHYSFDGIDHLVRFLSDNDEAWNGFLADSGQPVLRVSYEEDLERDREGTIRKVLEHVGIDVAKDWHPVEVTRRQADGLSERWVEAYHREAARRGTKPDSRTLSAR